MQSFVSHSEADTAKIAADFAKTLRPGDVIAFSGGLGAGKTTFTRYLCEALDCRDDVSSPTFALVHCYRAKMPIYHFDMYRISGLDNLYSTGFFDYLDAGGIIIIEWSENVLEFLPEDMIRIDIKRLGDSEREITVKRGETE